jgi:RES domain-containing protein
LIAAWRLVRQDHGARSEAFSGEGARLFGGRWNSAGIPMIYASDSLALAALEVLAHADRRRFERSYAAFRISVPDEQVLRLESRDLPEDWRARPVSMGARRIGDIWARERRSVALLVPSVLVPLERNLLLNPAHPDLTLVEIDDPRQFSFDSRLLG